MPDNNKTKVHFFFDNTSFYLSHRLELKAFIESIFRKEKRKLASLNYVFCTDKALLKINQDFLRHDEFTDIISFELSPDPDFSAGEIYISADRVRENAYKHGKTFKSELLRVIFHGALHLCGYRDKSTAEKALMRKKEDYYLNSYKMA